MNPYLRNLTIFFILAAAARPVWSASYAESYRWDDRMSTYAAYWDDPRPLQAEAEKILATIDPEREPKLWLQVFCAYGMASDSIHELPNIGDHLRRAKAIAEAHNLWELMIDALIIEGAVLESVNQESLPKISPEFGLDIAAPYERALKIAQEHHSIRNYYLVISNYMGYLRNKGQSTRIMSLMENAVRDLQIHTEFSFIDRVNLKKNLVFLYKVVEQDESVARYSLDLAEECTHLKLRSFCAYIDYDLGLLYTAGRIPVDYAKALEYLGRAEVLAGEVGDTATLSLVQLMLAKVAQGQNKPADAIRYAQESAAYARKVGYFSTIADAVLLEVNNQRLLKHNDQALHLLQNLSRELPENLYKHRADLYKLMADIHGEAGEWSLAYQERTQQNFYDRKYIEERSNENFSQQMVKMGLQLEQEKNKALLTQNELQERKLLHAAFERKTIALATFAMIGIAGVLFLGLVWVSRKNREIRKLHRFIETQVLQRFLPPKIVGDILAGKSHFEQKAQHRTVTVLFADLVNFTRSAERMQPHELTDILNSFFAESSEVVFEHGGVIDKFMGDAIMVVFGGPQDLPPKDQALAATACAERLLLCLERLNREWQDRFQISFTARIGIHQGPGVVGAFGSKRRSDYTVIGRSVNLASRIEGQALPNQILFSATVAEHLPAERKAYAGSFPLKGIEHPVPLFALRPQTVSKAEPPRADPQSA